MQTLAERTGFKKLLTLWVIKSALRQGAICQKENRAIAIAVNVSALSLLNPDLSEKLTGLLTTFNFPAVSITTWVFRA